jgi:hypothetical protein
MNIKHYRSVAFIVSIAACASAVAFSRTQTAPAGRVAVAAAVTALAAVPTQGDTSVPSASAVLGTQETSGQASAPTF